ncbi:hypothetical protein BJ742DRAFT_882814 [Cladochytrium replicatum]|nr:hypothetical protein BJ742DRAFT_882814 [Cladochytrium replicatum]
MLSTESRNVCNELDVPAFMALLMKSSELSDVIEMTNGDYASLEYVERSLLDAVNSSGHTNIKSLAQSVQVDIGAATSLVNNNESVIVAGTDIFAREHVQTLGKSLSKELENDGVVDLRRSGFPISLRKLISADAVDVSVGTDKYLYSRSRWAELKSRVLETLRSLKSPTSIRSLARDSLSLTAPSDLSAVRTIVETVVQSHADGGVTGRLQGGHSDDAIYIPNVFIEAEREQLVGAWIRDGYLRVVDVRKWMELAGLHVPKSDKNLTAVAEVVSGWGNNKAVPLDTVIVSDRFMEQMEGSLMEVATSEGWVDVTDGLPFGPDDGVTLANRIQKRMIGCILVSERFFVHQKWIDESLRQLLRDPIPREPIDNSHLAMLLEERCDIRAPELTSSISPLLMGPVQRELAKLRTAIFIPSNENVANEAVSDHTVEAASILSGRIPSALGEIWVSLCLYENGSMPFSSPAKEQIDSFNLKKFEPIKQLLKGLKDNTSHFELITDAFQGDSLAKLREAVESYLLPTGMELPKFPSNNTDVTAISERLRSSQMSQLRSQLKSVADPALVLHLTVLILFHCENPDALLHTPGRNVPHILSVLKVSDDVRANLVSFQKSIVKKLEVPLEVVETVRDVGLKASFSL